MPQHQRLVLDRIVGLDWYDGMTRGVALIRNSTAAIEFHQIAVDRRVEWRLFAVARTTRDVFDSVVSLCSRYEAPRWPNWMFLWNVGSEEEKSAIANELDQLLRNVSAPEFLCLAKHFDEEARRGIRLRAIPPEIQGRVPQSVEFEQLEEWLRLIPE